MNYESCPICGQHHETSACGPAGARCAVAACSPAEQPESERLAFLLGWRWAEKRRPRTPNPFTGIDRDLELMWDAGYEEGKPENVAGEARASENSLREKAR